MLGTPLTLVYPMPRIDLIAFFNTGMNTPVRLAPSDMVDTNLLRLFDLLYSTHSVTRSAELLGLSQPTVSTWLVKLRKQFNDPLFVRTTEGMQPTPRAEALISIVRVTLDSLRQLSELEPIFDPASAQRTFRICMTDASHITLLPQLLSHVRALAPGVRLDAARIDADMPHALEAGEADIAIGLIPQLEAGFYQQTLFTQDWVCLANAGHPRIGEALSLDQYAGESHILIGSGTGSILLGDALKRQKIERKVLLELPGFLGLSAILSSTDLIATLPRQIGETLARMAGLRVLACPVPIPSFTVKQHWHARYQHDAANRWLRGVCANLFLKP
jgi:DNA-binding transcriptional LysR family regulator